MYLIRLDDASERMDIKKWGRIESILDKYKIRPIVGVIPANHDKQLNKYKVDGSFWDKVLKWERKGWTIAMHGYEHVYNTIDGGMNPVQKRSEFAGLSYEEQCKKIRRGYDILKKHGVVPSIFFAPSHTFDINTLYALKKETSIDIISDTIANDVYYENGFYFIPQQSGDARKLPFKLATFCYHPNEMIEGDFDRLERFMEQYRSEFTCFDSIVLRKRRLSLYDKVLRKIYFIKRRLV